MSHYKRRKRKKYGVKGHCTMCASQIRHGGLRNKRIETRQEEKSRIREREQKNERG